MSRGALSAARDTVRTQLWPLLEELSWHAPLDDGQVISDHLGRLRATTTRADLDATELAQLARAGERVDAALLRRAGPATDGGDR